MVVCGDDALAERLGTELRELYRAQVTIVVPSTRTVDEPAQGGGRMRAAALLSRVQADRKSVV